ncbi:MAG: hypothetical protein WAN87_05090 [Thermoplasmata archaeon]
MTANTAPKPTKEDLKKKAEGWLNGEGYPLEMRVARALREAGFLNVNQSETYLDPVEEKWREIDITAAEFHVPNVAGETVPFNESFIVRLVLECTYSGTDPWIVFPRTPNALAEDYAKVTGRLWSQAARWIPRAIMDEVQLGNPIPSLLEFGTPVAYGVVRTGDPRSEGEEIPKASHARGKVPANTKVAQVVSAAQALQGTEAAVWSLAIPAVVVDAQLFSARLQENGRAAIEETGGFATLLQARHGAETPNLAVHLVTAEAFPDFAKAMRTGILEFFRRTSTLVPAARKIGNDEVMRGLG